MNKYQESFNNIVIEAELMAEKCNHKLEKDIKNIQELIDKATSTKPDFEGDGFDKDGNIIYDTWICPCCETRYEVDYHDYKYCPNCGQKLEWEVEE